mmetsp:Transcript_90478/g.194086  ORF Transcript_90478/g.194086 Transcript_90478/m.194086 type:complete len:246 (-) Transcript_90478:30-767(-)
MSCRKGACSERAAFRASCSSCTSTPRSLDFRCTPASSAEMRSAAFLFAATSSAAVRSLELTSRCKGGIASRRPIKRFLCWQSDSFNGPIMSSRSAILSLNSHLPAVGFKRNIRSTSSSPSRARSMRLIKSTGSPKDELLAVCSARASPATTGRKGVSPWVRQPPGVLLGVPPVLDGSRTVGGGCFLKPKRARSSSLGAVWIFVRSTGRTFSSFSLLGLLIAPDLRRGMMNRRVAHGSAAVRLGCA